MSEKIILVTGAGGYVGSHCVHDLLLEGYTIIGVDNFVNCVKAQDSNPSEINIKPESIVRVEKLTGKSTIFYDVDLTNKDALRKVFEKHSIDCVMHFAALKAVGESVRLPILYYYNNVLGSANLLDIMMEFKVKKIVFSSSATVYGDPEKLPIDENHPVGRCTNPYGKTKYFMEEIMRDVVTANPDWGVVLLRYFNPVGAHPSGEIGEDPQGIPNNLMPYIAQVAIGRREKLMVYGNDYDTHDGTGVRDYIHVMDLATGHSRALDKLLKPDFKGVKIYNLGTGRGNSVLDMVNAFEKATGAKVPYEITKRRDGDIATCYASCDLAKKELNFETKLNIVDMCKDTWNWQSKNPIGFNKK